MAVSSSASVPRPSAIPLMSFDEILCRYFTRSRPASVTIACQFVSNSPTLSRAARYSRSRSENDSGSTHPSYSAMRARRRDASQSMAFPR